MQVRLVSPKYLNSRYASFGEKILGCYIASDDLIYLDNTLSPELLLHTMLHEVSHMLDHQMSSFDIEQRADAYATFAINFYKIPNIQHLLGNKK